MRNWGLTLLLIGLLGSLGCENTPEIEAVQDRANQISSGQGDGGSTSSGASTGTPSSGSTTSSSGSATSSTSNPTGSTTTGSGSSSSGWNGSRKTFRLGGSSSGSVSFETRGITSQSGRNRNGGWEYIFLTLRGNNFNRVLLYQVGGGRDAIRYLISGPNPVTRLNATRDNLPGVHRWRVSWGGGQMVFKLDGRTLGRHTFNGRPTKAIVGGYDSRGRDFRGEWRNAVIE